MGAWDTTPCCVPRFTVFEKQECGGVLLIVLINYQRWVTLVFVVPARLVLVLVRPPRALLVVVALPTRLCLWSSLVVSYRCCQGSLS